MTDNSKHEAVPASGLSRFIANLGARAKKAWSAGVAGAALGIGGISVTGFWADGKIDTAKVGAAAGAVATGFVVGFLAAFLPKNAINPATPELQPAQFTPSTVDYRTEQEAQRTDPDEPKHLASS
ncbi:hypothetical protein [Curtobacterium sp. VKM Ac-2884]|uniref:hypothetical protein n=1 Tax=Curtobacterium sp. VKM Ac-2884 TaxID=2783818 RepID=UPI00188B8FA5|nr:hypothetical protein [Curtobacterium sp. VKM Ac-2884]MBF4602845.1 hypothetical protein [Curtobacterium sp. VKM Ac-2884]